jgi:hypothetical protein
MGFKRPPWVLAQWRTSQLTVLKSIFRSSAQGYFEPLGRDDQSNYRDPNYYNCIVVSHSHHCHRAGSTQKVSYSPGSS